MIDRLRDLRRKLRGSAIDYIRSTRILDPLRIGRSVQVEDLPETSVENYRILVPGGRVGFPPDENDAKFLRVCRYFNEGYFDRPSLFTCEVPDAYCHVGSGLICTGDLRAIEDSQMSYRIDFKQVRRWVRPLRSRHLKGTYATIHNLFAFQWWHWIIDCLSRIHSLEMAYPGERIVLLAPEEMGPTFKDSLDAMLPANFEVRYMPRRTWVRADRMILASYPPARGNGYLPPGYFASMKQAVNSRFGLPATQERTERIYIERSNAGYRVIVNQDDVIKLLGRYGFKAIRPERLSFEEQVKLFSKAEVVVGVQGSAWGNLVFSGPIDVLIIYPNAHPNTHMFTMAKGLGQRHFFLTHGGENEHSYITVDLPGLENVLENEMSIAPLKSITPVG